MVELQLPVSQFSVEGWTAIGIRCTRLWNSFNNAPSSIVFYLEMKVEVEVGVPDLGRGSPFDLNQNLIAS